MASLQEIQSAVTNQNLAIKQQEGATPAESAEKQSPQAVEEAKRAAQVDSQPTTQEKKAERRTKLDGLKQLADATAQKFTEAQELRRQRERADGELAEMRARLDQAEARAKQYEDRITSIDQDPWGYMQKKGVKLRELAERVAKQGSPDAAIEEVKSQLVAQAERHEQEMARLRADYEKANKEAAEKEAKAAMEARNAQARRDFLSAWDKGKSGWSYLDRVTEGDTQALIREFMVTYNDVKANPETGPYVDEYSNEELLAATNARLERLAKRLVVEAHAPAVAAAKPALTEAKPTLTTSTAVEPSAVPADFKKLSPTAQKKAMAEMYRNLRKTA